MKWGLNLFILVSRRVLPQNQRCWEENTSQIQTLRHFEKGERCYDLRLTGHALTGICMFDCPEHSTTIPILTVTLAVLVPSDTASVLSHAVS